MSGFSVLTCSTCRAIDHLCFLSIYMSGLLLNSTIYAMLLLSDTLVLIREPVTKRATQGGMSKRAGGEPC